MKFNMKKLLIVVPLVLVLLCSSVLAMQTYTIETNQLETLYNAQGGNTPMGNETVSASDSAADKYRVLRMTASGGSKVGFKLGKIANSDRLVFLLTPGWLVSVYYWDTANSPNKYKHYANILQKRCYDPSWSQIPCPQIQYNNTLLDVSTADADSNLGYWILDINRKGLKEQLDVYVKSSSTEVKLGQSTTCQTKDFELEGVDKSCVNADITTKDGIVVKTPKANIEADKFVILIPPNIQLVIETCSDGIKNQGETQVDCGGPNCAACAKDTAPQVCVKDNKCNFNMGENNANCPSDCYCGDGVCHTSDEDASSCAQDCVKVIKKTLSCPGSEFAIGMKGKHNWKNVIEFLVLCQSNTQTATAGYGGSDDFKSICHNGFLTGFKTWYDTNGYLTRVVTVCDWKEKNPSKINCAQKEKINSVEVELDNGGRLKKILSVNCVPEPQKATQTYDELAVQDFMWFSPGKSKWPYIVGLIVLVVIGVGVFFLRKRCCKPVKGKKKTVKKKKK